MALRSDWAAQVSVACWRRWSPVEGSRVVIGCSTRCGARSHHRARCGPCRPTSPGCDGRSGRSGSRHERTGGCCTPTSSTCASSNGCSPTPGALRRRRRQSASTRRWRGGEAPRMRSSPASRSRSARPGGWTSYVPALGSTGLLRSCRRARSLRESPRSRPWWRTRRSTNGRGSSSCGALPRTDAQRKRSGPPTDAARSWRPWDWKRRRRWPARKPPHSATPPCHCPRHRRQLRRRCLSASGSSWAATPSWRTSRRSSLTAAAASPSSVPEASARAVWLPRRRAPSPPASMGASSSVI